MRLFVIQLSDIDIQLSTIYSLFSYQIEYIGIVCNAFKILTGLVVGCLNNQEYMQYFH